MTLMQAVLLGIVQGLTEFLPVSSSGHLVLAKSIIGFEQDGITFEIFVHFGTLLAVITFYRKDLAGIMADLSAFIRRSDTHSGNADGARTFLFIVIATIPAAVLGLTFRSIFESAFSNPAFVSGALIFTGLVLTTTSKIEPGTVKLDSFKSIVIGFAQVIALFPGVSRSGTTITAGLLLGIDRNEATRFSFLMAIPLIIGVTLMKALEIISNPPGNTELLYYAVGSIAAYVSGLWAIKWLIKIVQAGRFNRFAYYCIAVGGLGLIFSWVQ